MLTEYVHVGQRPKKEKCERCGTLVYGKRQVAVDVRHDAQIQADATFMARARTDIPNLLQHIAALESRIENMKKEAAIDSEVEE